MISNELRTEMKTIRQKLLGRMPKGIAELPTGVKTTPFLALAKLNSNTLQQRAENGRLDRETFRLLLICKLTPYFGFIPLAWANLASTKNNRLLSTAETVYGEDSSNPVHYNSLHSSYKTLKETIKSEKTVQIEGVDVSLADTFRNFRKQTVENIKKGIQILSTQGAKLDPSEAPNLREYTETLKNDFIKSRDEGIKSTFYGLKLFKKDEKINLASPPLFIESKHLQILLKASELQQLLNKKSTVKGSQTNAASDTEANQLNAKDDAGNLPQRRKRGLSLGSAINRLANAGNLSTRRRRGFSLGSAINRSATTDDATTARKRSRSLNLTLDQSPNTADDAATVRKRSRSLGSAFSRLGNTVMGRRHRSVSLDDSSVGKSEPSEADLKNFTELVGDIANKLVQESQGKYADLLSEDVQKVLKGDHSQLHNVLANLKLGKTIILIDTDYKKYEIELPATFEEFTKVLDAAPKKAKETRRHIEELKSKYSKALQTICATANGWNVNALPVQALYTSIIADDPNIEKDKELNKVLDRLHRISGEAYKHAFYTMKLFKNNTIEQSKLPSSEFGLSSYILDSFKMSTGLDKLLLKGSIEPDQQTMDKLREEIKKLPPPSIGNLVGNTLGKIYDKNPELLNEDARAFLNDHSSHFDDVSATLESKKAISLVVKETIEEEDEKTKETKKTTKMVNYKIELPATFEEFQNVYKNTLKKANELIKNINVAGKKVRDNFLKNTCKSNGIDAHDKRVRIQLDSIYSEVTADDPTITTGKRLGQIVKDSDSILKDPEDMYKNAFFTLKLFKDGDIEESSIPQGCDITPTIGAFKFPLEFERILKGGTIAEDYSFSEKTKEKLREKIAKLRGETTKPLDAPAPSLDEFVVDTGSASGMDLGDSANVSTLPHIKQPDAPTPNLDELIGNIGPAPEMKPVVDVGSSTPSINTHPPENETVPPDEAIKKKHQPKQNRGSKVAQRVTEFEQIGKDNRSKNNAENHENNAVGKGRVSRFKKLFDGEKIMGQRKPR